MEVFGKVNEIEFCQKAEFYKKDDLTQFAYFKRIGNGWSHKLVLETLGKEDERDAPTPYCGKGERCRGTEMALEWLRSNGYAYFQYRRGEWGYPKSKDDLVEI